MRFSSASALYFIAASSTLAYARPIPDNNPVDSFVQSIDVPTVNKVDCDSTDPRCQALNNVGIHSVQDFKQHLGLQTGILSNAAGKAVTDLGAPEVGESITEDGASLGESTAKIESRAEEHSALNQALVDAATKHDISYPLLTGAANTAQDGTKTAQDVTQTVEDTTADSPAENAGKAVNDLGVGAENFGKEAHRFLGNGASRCTEANDCEKLIDGIVQ